LKTAEGLRASAGDGTSRVGMTKSKAKSKLTLRTLVRLSSEETYKQLAEAAKSTKVPKSTPEALKLKEIHVAPEVFQWKRTEWNVLASSEHTLDLARALQDVEGDVSPFPALLVYLIGERYYVLDGHHRLDAYHSVKWKHPVPVKVFAGTLQRARLKALEANSHNKLPMTRDDKTAAAWELTKTTNLSKEVVHKLTTASKGTVGNMRRTWKEVCELDRKQGGEGNPIELTWAKARMMLLEKQFPEYEDWKEAEIEKMAQLLLTHVGHSLTRHPDITAEAIRKLSPELPRQLIYLWAYKEREAIEAAIEDLREEIEF
jgi:ParB-like chromosome segregation protein Spo0J